MTETVRCPVCKRPTRVNLDGQLRKHKGNLTPGRNWRSWCPNQSPNGTVKADGAANGGRLTTPAEPGKASNSAGSKLPSRPTLTTRRQFDLFKDRVLSNPAAHAAYEDAEARNVLIDSLIGLRCSKGLTQVQIAEYMGIAQATVSEFETESSDPRVSTLQRYARAVGVDLVLELHPLDHEGAPNARSAARGNA